MARARSAGFLRWREAREKDDFDHFSPALDELISVVREQAACHHIGDHPYDAALEAFDPGSRVADLKPMFTRLGEALTPLVQAARTAPGPAPLPLHVTDSAFAKLNHHVLTALGYDFHHGRLDLAAHPFSVGIDPDDVRITTRYRNHAPLSTLGATIHECGHALYEQGLPTHLQDSGLCQAAGAGMHESQSRFWENQIGRSLPFFRWVQPALEEAVGHAINPEALYAAANRIEPGLIRVEADEATYNLHVIVRFELELGIFEGRLTASDLPEAWNAGYHKWLGVHVPDMQTGVLQDIHWASGLFGYFPSYTLGNLYAAGFGAAAEEAIPNLWSDVENGDFSAVLSWLRDRVHRRGRTVNTPRIFADAVGERDPVADLVEHLYARQGALYGISRPS
jgi:carboxypeptidase Taq